MYPARFSNVLETMDQVDSDYFLLNTASVSASVNPYNMVDLRM